MLTLYQRGIVLLFSLLLFACGQETARQSTGSIAPKNNAPGNNVHKKNVSTSIGNAEPAPALIHRKPAVRRQVISNELTNGDPIEPFRVIHIDGDILDLVVSGIQLLVASNGFMEVYELENFERVKRMDFEKIENFYGDLHLPHLFSADISPSGMIVFVKETANGKSVVQLQEGSGAITLIPENANLAIRKVRFLDEANILMATIESEVILFNLNESSMSYKHQLSLSAFSDFSINLENHQVVLADESGVIPYFDGDSGRVEFLLKGGNLDKIFDIDIAKNRIITGGKDRSVSIYNLESDVVDKYSTDFYIYAVALDENAERALLILDEDNHVGLFDIKTGKITAILQGDGKSLGFLKFISDHQALGATYNQIFLWSFR